MFESQASDLGGCLSTNDDMVQLVASGKCHRLYLLDTSRYLYLLQAAAVLECRGTDALDGRGQ